MNFDKAPIWIQIRGFPPHCRTTQVGRKIGESMGIALDIDSFTINNEQHTILKVMID